MLNDIDFIRYLIDLIAEKNTPPAPPQVIINIDNAGKVSSEEKPEEVETALDKDDVFVPPLQAKIEMMKKMTGVEPKNQDLLTVTADEDEPFDG
jgi:hypothetical protein